MSIYDAIQTTRMRGGKVIVALTISGYLLVTTNPGMIFRVDDDTPLPSDLEYEVIQLDEPASLI